MAKISATEQRVLQVTTSPQKVYAFFSQPEQLCQAMDGVESFETLEGGKVHWVLEEKRDQGICFQPDYVMELNGDGTSHVTWRTVAGNMGDDGEVWIDPLPEGGSQIRYLQTVEPDLPITPLMARLLKPLVARELRKDVLRFLEQAERILSS
jgi:uncharacterized membrane protein